MTCIKAPEVGGRTNGAACCRYDGFNGLRSLPRGARRGASITPYLRTSSDADRSTGWRAVREKIMVRIYILRVSLAFALILPAGKTPESRAEEGASVQQSITEAQVALRHRHYSQAIRILEDALRRFPGNIQLRLELGRAYVYQRLDSRAMAGFRAILRDHPSHREANIKLARDRIHDGHTK